MRKDCINKEVEFLIKKAAEENGIIIKNIAVGLDHIHVHAVLPTSVKVLLVLFDLLTRVRIINRFWMKVFLKLSF